MLDISKYQIPENANHVNRFAGNFMVGHRSSISEHSYEVTYYALMVCTEWSKNVLFIDHYKSDILEACILHDIPEIYTGDIPYPVKARFPEMKGMLSNIENTFMETVLPEYSKKVYHPIVQFIVKYCDTIAVAREIITEHELGNRAFDLFIPNIQKIFNSLYHDTKLKTYEDWELIKSDSINTLVNLGLARYVKTTEF